MKQKRCTGWWEQSGSREEMEGLLMNVDGENISGSGYDVIGTFTFTGTVDENNEVVMIKEYLGKHRVLYKGEYDGKELIWGIWLIGYWTGPWEIRFRDGKEEGEEASEKEALRIHLSDHVI